MGSSAGKGPKTPNFLQLQINKEKLRVENWSQCQSETSHTEAMTKSLVMTGKNRFTKQESVKDKEEIKLPTLNLFAACGNNTPKLKLEENIKTINLVFINQVKRF